MKARHVGAAALVAVAGAALVAPSAAQTAEAIRYETFTLDNGLQFIVHEDHSVPVVHVEVWYDVGSAHEPPGRSGFAHLFEHMMFIQTENLERGRFDALITGSGGTLNGTTNKDRTAYYQTVPSNQLNVVLWLEADRMKNLVVNEENFQREREVVKEERRLRVDNQPYGHAIWEVMDTLPVDYEPYEHSVIGSMADLDAATGDDARQFYEEFYVPNNAAVVVAGDATVDQVRTLAERFFGHMRRGPEVPPLPPVTGVPRTDGPREVSLTDAKATLPLIDDLGAGEEHTRRGVDGQVGTPRPRRVPDARVEGDLFVVGVFADQRPEHRRTHLPGECAALFPMNVLRVEDDI